MTDEIDRTADRSLRRARPEPGRDFGEQLRAQLLEQHAAGRRPARLWLLVAAYVCSGVVLLLLAALSASGGGPFGS
jgi:hypothetical protein